MPEANSDHIVAVMARQRAQFLDALTISEINNAALTARVTEMEDKIVELEARLDVWRREDGEPSAKAAEAPGSSKVTKKT